MVDVDLLRLHKVASHFVRWSPKVIAEDLSSPFVLLDDSRSPSDAGRSLLFQSPDRVICARTIDEVPLSLARIDQAVADGFHVAGWIAYEASAAFEDRIAKAIRYWPKEPLIYMLVTRDCREMSPDEVHQWVESHAGNASAAHLVFGANGDSKACYRQSVDQIQNYILAGDIYQANYTFPRACRVSGRTIDLYRALRQAQPVEFGAFIHTDDHTILSFSPELFVRRVDDRLEARPMKGTAARCDNIVEDREAAIALSADAKSRAENLMIVDLIRNDLSRVAVRGSVSVSDLFTIESYPTLHQMTSGIEAGCQPDLKPSELLEALFPCGSVTGAPKIRSMEIIADMERSARGVYCGAIGHFSPAVEGAPARWSLNVPIRTFVFDAEGDGRLAVGSGIVADSQVAAEYDECLLKAAFAQSVARPPFVLIETMRMVDGKIPWLDAHLERLLGSAAYFGIPAHRQSLLDAVADVMGAGGPFRVRMTLDEQSAVSAERDPLEIVNSGELSVAVSSTRLNSQDMWLRHKTSNRSLYDRATEVARASGLADILFLNERGEVAEGAISSVFLETEDGWVTPSLDSGVLPGVLRAQLLADPERSIKEKPVTLDDLYQAKTIHIGNALRGLRQVTLREGFIDISV